MYLQSKGKKEQISSIEKRAFKRLPVNIDARFFHGGIFYSGIFRNLSDQGMFIATKKHLPCNSIFVVVIPEEKDFLKVIVKVKRVSTNSNPFSGMGVKLISPSSGFLDFVRRLDH